MQVNAEQATQETPAAATEDPTVDTPATGEAQSAEQAQTQAAQPADEVEQVPTTEAKAPEDPKFARKLTELARRQKKLDETASKAQELSKVAAPFIAAKEAYDKNDLGGFFKALNMDEDGVLDFYNKLTEQVIVPSLSSPEQKKVIELERKVKSIEQAKEDESKRHQEQREKAERDAAIASWHQEYSSMIKSSPKYELSAIYEQEALALADSIQIEYFQKYNDGLSAEKVAELVEGHFEEETARLTGANKIKSRFVPQTLSSETRKVEGKPPGKAISKTLSNTLDQNVPARDGGSMSQEDRLRRAESLAAGMFRH